MRNFWAQNGPFHQMRIFFSENLLMILVSFIYTYLHATNQNQILIITEILTIKECWNLTGQEPFLAITWESDFSQTCSFHRMLMSHNNFHFMQIQNKTNNVIFLKSPKTMFLWHFGPFLVIFARWGFFPNNPALLHTTIYEPLTPC